MTRSQIRHRPRRNRVSAAIRSLISETALSPADLILPIFIVEGNAVRTPIESMPDCHRVSLDLAVEEAKKAFDLGIPAVALFPALSETLKDKEASESLNPEGLLQKTVRAIKQELSDLAVITDVAMDPYSSDGHDGVYEDGKILNDPTLEILGKMAVSQAEAGADIVAPSDMMDGRVGHLREVLDQNGFTEVGILAYSAKYASAFYGPFRDALDSSPKAGDKKTYQMDPANVREAIREVKLDVAEGADIVMVKPALAYLDIISAVKKEVALPVAAYSVSGEYSMVKAAARNGWLDEKAIMAELLLSIKRAGADMVLTYFAVEMAKVLKR